MNDKVMEVVLDQLKYAAETVVTDEFLAHASFDIGRWLSEHQMRSIRSNFIMYGEEFPPVTRTYVHPDGWWETFKHKHFPAWALKRWPVKWKKIELSISAKHVYSNIPAPKDLGPRHTSVFIVDNAFKGE